MSLTLNISLSLNICCFHTVPKLLKCLFLNLLGAEVLGLRTVPDSDFSIAFLCSAYPIAGIFYQILNLIEYFFFLNNVCF